MQCSGGLESFGKKRRKRALVGPEMTIELTTPLSPAVEDSDSSSESRKFHAQLILVLRPRARVNVVVQLAQLAHARSVAIMHELIYRTREVTNRGF